MDPYPKTKDFFIRHKVLSKKFRGKFLDFLPRACDKDKLSFKGKLAIIGGKRNFKTLLNGLYKKAWVVNTQKPFTRPGEMLESLSRYVFRIARGECFSWV